MFYGRIRGVFAVALLLLAGTPAVAAESKTDPKQAILEAAKPVRLGEAPATAGKKVDVRAAVAGPQIAAPPEAAPKPAADRKTRPPSGSKPIPAARPVDPHGPNVSKDGLVGPMAGAPNVPLLNTDGTTQAEAGSLIPDPNAAVGAAQIVETTNVFLKVRDKFLGGVQCQVGLNTFLGTGEVLTDPRVQFDTLNDRFTLVVSLQPASPTAVPALWVAATAENDACGGWFAYRITFPMIINGLQLDFPNLGQDRNALIITTNNVGNGEIINATVFALAKFNIYTGTVPGFTVFGINKNTAPALVAGTPMVSTPATYLMSAIPTVGYLQYEVLNAGSPAMSVGLIRFLDSPYSDPSGQLQQCAPNRIDLQIEGGIDAHIVQTDQFLWFTHTALDGGFRIIRYGALRIADGALFINLAFHSVTSDDFNPSIGVGIFGPNLFFLYLNWAYVDRGAVPCQNASATINAVLPNEGVPTLAGTDGTLVVGGPAPFAARFGDYSSVSIDPSPPDGCFAGSGVVTSQHYFGAGGQWRTRLGRFCFA